MPEKEGEESIIIKPAGRNGEPPSKVPGSTWVPFSKYFSPEEIAEKDLRPSEYKLVRNEDDSDENVPVSSLFKTLPADKMKRDYEKAGEPQKGAKN